MMADDTHCSITLPNEALPLAWQILGVDESPFRPSLDQESLPKWVRNRISCGNQDTVINEIQG